MAKRRKKKILRKTRRQIKNSSAVFLCGFSILFFGLLIFLYINSINQQKSSVSVFPQNPSQGGTVVIKIKSDSAKVEANFDGKKITFLKTNDFSGLVALVGVDAKTAPGTHKIDIKFWGGARVKKEINVAKADFPSFKITGETNADVSSNIVNKDNPSLYRALFSSSSVAYFNSPFSYPLSNIRKSGFDFGDLLNFPNNKLQHLGVDLSAPFRAKVYTINSGKVVFADNLPDYGKSIIIDHGLGIFSLYLHLDEFVARPGQIVKQGEAIGFSGDTGYSSGPHLHFSIKVDGSSVDPLIFIEATKSI